MPLEHGHSPEAIEKRLAAPARPSHVRDFVYGGIDGTITTFAVVAGVLGGGLSTRTIVILGIANLLADGFSMAASDYSATRAQAEEKKRARAMEERHVATIPEGEREEVRQIFRQKGFEGEMLDRVVETITADRDRWIDTMVAEEHGQPQTTPSAMKSGLATFVAFVLCGAFPLIPFILGMRDAFAISIALTGIVFFAIGSAKSRYSIKSWWRSGAETFAIGMMAAVIAYGIGYGLKQWLG